jgi:AbrB family looped-hinge helix DNA binding protein
MSSPGVTEEAVMATAVVSAKGWVVIPKALRDKHGLEPGQRVAFVDDVDSVTLVPIPNDPVTALRGMLCGGPALTEELLADRERDRKREDSR